MLRKSGMHGVHVGSIATAQGSEWDYVILSAVRSGAGKGSLGLVADPHNFNVALTRAKLGLVVLCDSEAMRHNPNWDALITRCNADGLLVNDQPVVHGNPIEPPLCEPPAPISRPQFPPPPPPLPFSMVTAEAGNSIVSTGRQISSTVDFQRVHSIEIQMQIAALLTSQHQSQAGSCSPYADACRAYSSVPSMFDGSSFLGQQLSAPMPSSLLHANVQQLLPRQDIATQILAHPPFQSNQEITASAPPHNASSEIMISDASRSPGDGRKRHGRSPSDSRQQCWHEPKKHATNGRQHGYQSSPSENRRESPLGQSSSSFQARWCSTLSDGDASGDSMNIDAHRLPGPMFSSPCEFESVLVNSMSAASTADPVRQKGPRNALFSQLPVRAPLSHRYDERSIGG